MWSVNEGTGPSLLSLFSTKSDVKEEFVPDQTNHVRLPGPKFRIKTVIHSITRGQNERGRRFTFMIG